MLNGRWNQDGSDAAQDKRFEKAVETCGEGFRMQLAKFVESDLPAKAIVEKAFLKRYEIDESGEVIWFKEDKN